MLRGVLSPDPNDGKQRSLLILIVGIVDDMAYGAFSFTNIVYFSIH